MTLLYATFTFYLVIYIIFKSEHRREVFSTGFYGGFKDCFLQIYIFTLYYTFLYSFSKIWWLSQYFSRVTSFKDKFCIFWLTYLYYSCVLSISPLPLSYTKKSTFRWWIWTLWTWCHDYKRWYFPWRYKKILGKLMLQQQPKLIWVLGCQIR